MCERPRSLCLLALAVACGCEPTEGDYWVYRVAFSPAEEAGGCWYPDEEAPPDVANDSETHFHSSTLTLYAAGSGLLLMDVPLPPRPACASSYLQALSSITLTEDEEGEEGDYLFRAVGIDTHYLGDNQDQAVQTDTTTTSLVLEISGSCVEGTLESKTVTRCEFITATPMGDVCPAPPIPDRTVTWTFSGVELSDVELTQDVDKSAASPPPPP